MDRDPKLRIRDIHSGETFSVAWGNTEFVTIRRDGVKIRLHPNAIRVMIKPGAKFDGQTILGPRTLERMR
jgi:hypothetical protein